MRLRVRILTPDRVFQKEEIEELILPTSTGQIGVLKDHAPLLTALDVGPRLLRRQSDWTALALIGGFALIKGNEVTILVNEVVASSSVEKSSVEKDLADCTNRINQASGEKEKVEAAFLFKRARARYQVVQWKKLFNFKLKLCRDIVGREFELFVVLEKLNLLHKKRQNGKVVRDNMVPKKK
jgi:ATP synthase F1 epsilon subunit